MPSSRSIAIPARRCAGVVALAVALSGCLWPDTPVRPLADADGLPCGAGPAEAVYLEVRYGADGMPSVEPVVCEIDRGTRVTWRGPVDAPVEFSIRFKGESPVPNEPRGVFVADRGSDRYRVQRTLDGEPGRYDYAVLANGRELDPAIIIR